MIKLFYLFLLYTPLTGQAMKYAAGDPIITATELIKSGKIHEFAKMFASTVELTILNEENIYSATQAEQVLENFFKNNAVKTVSVLHKVASNANYKFAVYKVATSSTAYRVSVSFKQTDERFLVNEIRIEAEKKE